MCTGIDCAALMRCTARSLPEPHTLLRPHPLNPSCSGRPAARAAHRRPARLRLPGHHRKRARLHGRAPGASCPAAAVAWLCPAGKPGTCRLLHPPASALPPHPRPRPCATCSRTAPPPLGWPPLRWWTAATTTSSRGGTCRVRVLYGLGRPVCPPALGGPCRNADARIPGACSCVPARLPAVGACMPGPLPAAT